MSEDKDKTTQRRLNALLTALHFVMPKSDFEALATECVQYELKAIA